MVCMKYQLRQIYLIAIVLIQEMIQVTCCNPNSTSFCSGIRPKFRQAFIEWEILRVSFYFQCVPYLLSTHNGSFDCAICTKVLINQ
jgi:hypothetical protein